MAARVVKDILGILGMSVLFPVCSNSLSVLFFMPSPCGGYTFTLRLYVHPSRSKCPSQFLCSIDYRGHPMFYQDIFLVWWELSIPTYTSLNSLIFVERHCSRNGKAFLRKKCMAPVTTVTACSSFTWGTIIFANLWYWWKNRERLSVHCVKGCWFGVQ